MAGIWADFPSGSLGLYGGNASAMSNGVWSNIGGSGQIMANIFNDPDPQIGAAGKVLGGGPDGNDEGVRFILPTAQSTVGIGLHQWLSSLPGSTADSPIPAGWRNGSNQVIGYVYIGTTGEVNYFNRYDNTVIATSDGPVVTPNAWWHLECKLTCSDSGAAEIEVRVNGVTKLAHSGFTTGVGTGTGAVNETSQIIINKLNQPNGNATVYWKNVVIWDGSGSEANDFQGSVTVFFNPVVTDLATAGWVLSSGSDASALIGHAGPPADSNYIEADDSPPAPAEFELADLPPDVTSIRFIVPVVRAAKVDGGDANLQVGLSPNGTDYAVGPDTPITTAFTYWGNSAAPFVSHINPETTGPWTPSDFNVGVRLRLDRTA